jgi:predicted ABC-type transport system involved in lysophospholipase L1 biosynthesis ATPase subunit
MSDHYFALMAGTTAILVTHSEVHSKRADRVV